MGCSEVSSTGLSQDHLFSRNDNQSDIGVLMTVEETEMSEANDLATAEETPNTPEQSALLMVVKMQETHEPSASPNRAKKYVGSCDCHKIDNLTRMKEP
jgi:hypothetical protein